MKVLTDIVTRVIRNIKIHIKNSNVTYDDNPPSPTDEFPIHLLSVLPYKTSSSSHQISSNESHVFRLEKNSFYYDFSTFQNASAFVTQAKMTKTEHMKVEFCQTKPC